MPRPEYEDDIDDLDEDFDEDFDDDDFDDDSEYNDEPLCEHLVPLVDCDKVCECGHECSDHDDGDDCCSCKCVQFKEDK